MPSLPPSLTRTTRSAWTTRLTRPSRPSRPTTRRLLSVFGALLAALLCALSFGASSASAHAALTETDPADGAVVKAAPSQVRLTFSEGVLLSGDSVRVLDPKGNRVDTGKPAHVGGKSSTAGVALHAGLPDGTFTVAWKVVSEDSHPVAGAFTFSIGAPSKTKAKVPSAAGPDETVETLYDIGRYVAYGGFTVLVGGCVFAGLCRSSRPVQKLTVGGWVALFSATLLLLLLRGPYTDGKGIGGVFDLGGLSDVLSTKAGAALLSRLMLLGAAALFLAVLFGSYARRAADEDQGRRQDLAFGLAFGGTVVSVGIAATWAMAEHASVGIQSTVAMPVDVVHLLAVGVWLGGLAALVATLRAGEPIGRTAVHRFSRLAFGSVVVLVLTGLYQSWRQVGSWDALTGTEYGRWLLVKVGLVAVLVAIASVSRRWTGRLTDEEAKASGDEAEEEKEEEEAKDTEEAAAADPVRTAQLARQKAAVSKAAALRKRHGDLTRGSLYRSVLAETVVAVVLLAVATVLSTTQPGRAASAVASAKPGGAAVDTTPAVDPISVEIPYNTGPKSGRGKAIFMLDPALPGDNLIHVFTFDLADRPVDAEEAKVTLTLPKENIGPLTVPLEHVATGHWSAKSFQLPMGGTWRLALTVRTSDIDQVTETRTLKIGQ
ncbi:copper resistance CopC/CopD family protein [Streptomyces lonegramiae]|uniref:Copper resistance protein CopC n=1 Tax=Streptomyces lonegramiae TaxID=3075524 RepID=A0ABU2XIC8_9ACTN|nr:copper resistance protein CopC [Streptomyces sp. DSM 41529]MDT0545577.1 copper resistance protein CopC [Streptomyces sp. DSM 41529]